MISNFEFDNQEFPSMVELLIISENSLSIVFFYLDRNSMHKPPALPVRFEKVLPLPKDH